MRTLQKHFYPTFRIKKAKQEK